mmetsp:Transcript_4598/g.11825  ORF Transcript_4598/g.11825 Transcript_4598/m.11825 type:complete len:741 (+) Transcript_4598:231-2453(+)
MFPGTRSPTNLGLLLVVALTSCGLILDERSPSFFAAAQMESNGSIQDDSLGSVSTPEQVEGDGTTDSAPVPAQTPSSTTAGFPVSAPTPAEECPLNCANDAECKIGEHNFRFHPKEPNGATLTFLQTTNREGWFCDCPMGSTGLRCTRPYEICPLPLGDTEGEEIHFCYHGGKCIEGLGDAVDASQHFCDCSNAEHNGVPYYGKYCEIEGAVKCQGDSEQYCTAQGTCKEDVDTKFYPCECMVGHRGPHCEYLRGTVPNCTLPCDGTIEGSSFKGGNGFCRLGIREYESTWYKDFWEEHDGNYQYCSCPEGWFGDNCEIPGTECGNAHCFNGGTCLESLNNNGETMYACDCRQADHLGMSWAGQYCENAETSNCNAGPDGSLQHANGHLFCTNGGTCKDPNNPHLGCNCPEGLFGSQCEFKHKEEAECSLQCQNGGECRPGQKDTSLLKKLGMDKMSEYNKTHHSELFEHCVCTPEYFGVQCEHKLEICPGGDHVCLHGSQCMAMNEGGTSVDELDYTCDCDTAFDSLEKYAGKYCQYTSTDICTKNGQPGMGKANFAFCVNNGVCKSKVDDGEDPPGCFCPERFYGDHCEYLDTTDHFDGGYDDDGDYDGGYADDDYKYQYYSTAEPQPQATPQSSKYALNQRGVVMGLSAAVIVIVVIFIAVVLRTLITANLSQGGKAADIQAAITEEETAAGYDANASGIIYSNSGDSTLDDIEVDDYVNNHATVLTDKEMHNVQLV